MKYVDKDYSNANEDPPRHCSREFHTSREITGGLYCTVDRGIEFDYALYAASALHRNSI